MVIEKEKLKAVLEDLKSKNKKIVFTNGCFDIIHSGHITYLYKAKSYGDILVIGLNSDDSVKRLKGVDRPINNQTDRALVLSALEMVDYVCIFNENTPIELITELKPDVLVKGGDYTKDAIVGSDLVEANGGKVIIVPFVQGKSTTKIINKIKK